MGNFLARVRFANPLTAPLAAARADAGGGGDEGDGGGMTTVWSLFGPKRLERVLQNFQIDATSTRAITAFTPELRGAARNLHAKGIGAKPNASQFFQPDMIASFQTPLARPPIFAVSANGRLRRLTKLSLLCYDAGKQPARLHFIADGDAIIARAWMHERQLAAFLAVKEAQKGASVIIFSLPLWGDDSGRLYLPEKRVMQGQLDFVGVAKELDPPPKPSWWPWSARMARPRSVRSATAHPAFWEPIDEDAT